MGKQRRGAEAFSATRSTSRELYDSIEHNRVALKGPVTTPIGGGFASINVTLRKKFELFANFRPIKNLPGTETRYPGIDLIIVRENTEDLYAGLEHEVVPGVVETSRSSPKRLHAHRQVRLRIRPQARPQEDPLHPQSQHHEALRRPLPALRPRGREGFPEVTYGEHIVDNTCMQLVINPYQYDMLVLPNLYGDIVSDLCAAFVGGLGLVPGANLGRVAIFEAVHGSAPDIAGKDIANPTALLQSAILMLHHIDETAPRTACRPRWKRSTPRRPRSPATSAALPGPRLSRTPSSPHSNTHGQ